MMDTDEMLMYGGGALLIGLTVFSGGGLGEVLGGGAGAELKQARNAMNILNQTSLAKTEFLGARREIAEQRFAAGCLLHWRYAEVQNPEHTARGMRTIEFLTVREGDRLIDPSTGGMYSPGTTVCDAYDNTAIIGADGVAEDAAFSGSGIGTNYARQYLDRFNQSFGGL
jgi:hypothetical protein